MRALAPTTDYKASILAGLTPSVILEIAARAMSFWTYQTSQENAYLSLMLERSEEAKCGLESQLNHCQGELHNARSKIAGECLCLRRALTQRGLLAELDNAQRKAQDTTQAASEKDRELSRLRGNVNDVKRRAPLGSAAQATEHLQPRLSTPIAHGGKVVVSARSQSTPHTQAPQPFVPTPTHNPFSRSYPTVPSSTARYSAPPHAPFALHERVDTSNRRVPHGIGIRARTTGSQKSVSENGSSNRRLGTGGIGGAFVDGRQRQGRGAVSTPFAGRF
ncbi:hypothetical protein JCM24511_04370 [Saitozyma sp. JCM 24511]|nr:hypothetical protein JCM24511_04370 [Saitozyma sp. JCM 24511]